MDRGRDLALLSFHKKQSFMKDAFVKDAFVKDTFVNREPPSKHQAPQTTYERITTAHF